MTVDPRFERSVHRWLRAYPRRWRLRRGDELVALLADLAAPGATRVDARTAAGLVRAGWATRARTRPPLRHVLAYRLFDRRVPARYRGWVRDDLEGASAPLRMLGNLVVLFVAVSVLLPLVTGDRPHMPSWTAVVLALGMSVGVLSRGRWQLQKQARKHLVADAGEELTADTFLFGWVMRDRLTVRGSAGMLAVAVGVVGLGAVTACLTAPTRLATAACGDACVETVTAARSGTSPVLLVALAGALASGVLGSPLARRRLRQLVPVRPAQPSRRLVRPIPRHRMLVAVLSGCFLGLAWVEGSGRADLFFSVGVAVGALLALPALLVVWLTSRSGPADLALVDALRIAFRGRPPGVDTVQEGLVPALVSTD
ncbi:hypothetical protein [Cellulomonas sp. Leaf334]|uniref:hypothetical protein n=1 Tax=Cellulomonas sp. Leaf334 TaxID=1736339 RepID=UPI0006F55A91|nr:hypothetical protein [Cellulomonas sp. Leaf334]KQR08340.1 hypothetical protein ASF78_18825 [Cellulomonas sp. Leaf334]